MPSAARLLTLGAGPADEEPFEEEELQVPGGDDEEAEGRRPPADVLRVGQKQEVVSAFAHAAEAVIAEDVKDGSVQSDAGFLQQNQSKLSYCHVPKEIT